MRRVAALSLALLALVISGCSDDKSVATPSPPAIGGTSAKYRVPIPAGAIADPNATRPDDERYKVSDKSVPDIHAFYAKDVDNKPLEGYEWCGVDNLGTRMWTKGGAEPDTTDLLTVSIAEESSETFVTISKVTASSSVSCPPQGPEG